MGDVKRKVIGYVRVSTDKQADSGISLDAQEEAINNYCRLYNIESTQILREEGKSATSLKRRPLARKILEEIQAGEVSDVIIYKLDRLFRSTRDALDFAELCKENNTNIHSIQDKIDTSSAMGVFFFTLLSAIAELESSIIAERTLLAMNHLKENGLPTGGRLRYGESYVPDPDNPGKMKVVTNPEEMKVLKIIMKLYLEFHNSPSRIADTLNNSNIPSKMGGKWHRTQVWRLLDDMKLTPKHMTGGN